MDDPTIEERRLRRGRAYPYDAPDAWPGPDDNEDPYGDPFPARDWAHEASRGVVTDLCDRRGIKNAFQGINEEVRAELVASLAAIIRVAGADVVRDAARYRWLRADNAYAPEEQQVTGGQDLDDLCDAGIAGRLYAP